MHSNPISPGAASLNPEYLLTFFGSISKEGSLEILKDLLARNLRANLNLVVQVATKYSEPLGPENLIKLFEDFKSFEGLFYYLGTFLPTYLISSFVADRFQQALS